MRFPLTALTLLLTGILTMSTTAASPIAIVIHAGAGGKARKMAPEKEKEYHDTLAKALRAGHAVLKKGGPAIEAVQAAIVVMEDSTLFNAGKGAVFTSAGENELDASIMDGKTLLAGAVGGVTVIKNPIRAAHAVMEKTPHVMLAGDGADAFAKKVGLEIVPRKYFYTEHRWKQLEEWKAKQKTKKQSQLEMTREYLGWMFDNTDFMLGLDRPGIFGSGTSINADLVSRKHLDELTMRSDLRLLESWGFIDIDNDNDGTSPRINLYFPGSEQTNFHEAFPHVMKERELLAQTLFSNMNFTAFGPPPKPEGSDKGRNRKGGKSS